MNSAEASPTKAPALVEAGLTEHQARLYEVLVAHVHLPASQAARLSGVPRTLAYKALGELEKFGLVSKDERPGAVTQFYAAHPFKLKELADKRLEDAKDARNALEGVLSKMISEFNTVTGTPGIRVLEGISGVAELYEDELNERQDLRLIRSPYDNDHPDLDKLIQKQIADQVKLGIKVKVIAPMTANTPRRILASDKERGVERRIIPREEFMIPAQVVMYANKVAITAYEGPLITTIIENPAIKKTFELIFDYLWKLAEKDHERILASIQATE